MVRTRAQALSITGPTIGEIRIVIQVVFRGIRLNLRNVSELEKNPSLKHEGKNKNLQIDKSRTTVETPGRKIDC